MAGIGGLAAGGDLDPRSRTMRRAIVGGLVFALVLGAVSLSCGPGMAPRDASPVGYDRGSSVGIGLNDSRVAATVNGVTITEGDVTSRIASFRSAMGLRPDDAWLAYLATQGMDAREYRDYTLEQLVYRNARAMAAAEQGISVSDEEVAEAVRGFHDGYLAAYEESDLNDEEKEARWAATLASSGFDAESYVDQVRDYLLEEALMEELEAQGVTDYAAWIQGYYGSCDIHIEEAPANLPYATES